MSMRDMREFYEGYWRWRQAHNLLHTDNVPERVHAALRLLGQQPIQRVLDMGCGEGVFGRVLRAQVDRQITLVGTDISAAALALASQQYDAVHLVDLERDDVRAQVGERPFDAIIALEVLEHLFAPHETLVQLRALLAPGGQIIVSFPNIAWWRYRWMLLRGRFPEEHHLFASVEHLQHFTLPSFTRLLTQSGYRITGIDGHFLQPIGVRQLPHAVRHRLNGHWPNLFGYQIVLRAVPR